MSDTIKTKDAEYENYARNEAAKQKFDARFSNIIKSFGIYEAGYDKGAAWLTNKLKDTDDLLSKELNIVENEIKKTGRSKSQENSWKYD